MAAGLAVDKEPGTDRFAARFQAAGYTVVAFDYRRFGGSGGQPRQVLAIADQLDDWAAALTFAAALPEVDHTRVAAWGSSVSGGHVLAVAARHAELAAAIAQTPTLDGPAATQNAARYQTFGGLLRTGGRAAADALGGLVGRPPRLIALNGSPRFGRPVDHARCSGRGQGARSDRPLPAVAACRRRPAQFLR